MRRPLLLLLLLCCLLLSAQEPPLHPGPLTDGTTLLATGWRIKPAGMQVKVGPFPTASALSPDGKFLVVVNSSGISVIRMMDHIVLLQIEALGVGPGIAFASKCGLTGSWAFCLSLPATVLLTGAAAALCYRYVEQPCIVAGNKLIRTYDFSRSTTAA